MVELWDDYLRWREEHPDVVQKTLEAIRERGPLGSADFERPANAKKTKPWDWYGPKETRVALDALWMTGELMVHSRRAGQKVYDLRERVLAETYGEAIPLRRRLCHRRGEPAPFRPPHRLGAGDRHARPGCGTTSACAATNCSPPTTATDAPRRHAPPRSMRWRRWRVRATSSPSTVDGLPERAYLGVERLDDLERIRSGAAHERTTLLSPFDSLIWDRLRARQLFGHEVVFEAYIVPEKRRYGYYSLAILHRGQIVGRLDPKMDRATQAIAHSWRVPGARCRGGRTPCSMGWRRHCAIWRASSARRASRSSARSQRR